MSITNLWKWKPYPKVNFVIKLVELVKVKMCGCQKDVLEIPLWELEDDALPSSLMGSTANQKVKIVKGEGIGACSLACNTSKVEGCAGALGWD